MTQGQPPTPPDDRPRRKPGLEIVIPLYRKTSRNDAREHFFTSDQIDADFSIQLRDFIFIILPGNDSKPPKLVLRPRTQPLDERD